MTTKIDLDRIHRDASAASGDRNGDNWVMADIGPPRPTEVLAFVARIRELEDALLDSIDGDPDDRAAERRYWRALLEKGTVLP